MVEAFAGSETVSTTEWSLTTDTAGPDTETSDGEFMIVVDLNAMTVSETFEFKVYEKAQSGDTQRVLYSAQKTGVQGTANIYFGPFPLMQGWDMTLKKLAGTDRTITWSIREVSQQSAIAAISAAGIADAVWDEAAAGHTTAGSFGKLFDLLTGVNVTSIAANVITATSIATDAITAAKIAADAIGASELASDAVTEIATGVWATVMEGTKTAKQFMTLMRARLWGKATVPSGDGSYAYRDLADTKDRIAGTVAATARTVATEDGT